MCVCVVCSQGCDVHLSIQWSHQRNPDHYWLQAALRQRGTGATHVASWKKRALRCCVNALTHVSVHPQESQFILDINLGAISRLETINVPNLGETTKGLELVCKVCLLFQSWRLFCFLSFSVIIDRGDMCPPDVSPHQDMRSPRFAYKKESSQPDIVEVLSKHAFPLCHNLVSLIL